MQREVLAAAWFALLTASLAGQESRPADTEPMSKSAFFEELGTLRCAVLELSANTATELVAVKSARASIASTGPGTSDRKVAEAQARLDFYLATLTDRFWMRHVAATAADPRFWKALRQHSVRNGDWAVACVGRRKTDNGSFERAGRLVAFVFYLGDKPPSAAKVSISLRDQFGDAVADCSIKMADIPRPHVGKVAPLSPVKVDAPFEDIVSAWEKDLAGCVKAMPAFVLDVETPEHLKKPGSIHLVISSVEEIRQE